MTSPTTIPKTENYEFVRPKMSTRKRTTVFVEGPTDKVLWKRFFSKNYCKLERVDNKPKVMSRLRSSQERKECGFAGIVDADYWLISNAKELKTANLLYDSCFPDAETILVHSAALKIVIANNLLLDDLDAMDVFTQTLREESCQLAMEYGFYRWLEHCHDLGLPCNATIEQKTNKIVNLPSRRINHAEITSLLTVKNVKIGSKQLQRKVDDLRRKRPPNTVQLCRGKDILIFMAHILPSLYKEVFHRQLSKRKRPMLKADPIATQLRGAYHESDFKATSLFSSICNWEDSNCRFTILDPKKFERTS